MKAAYAALVVVVAITAAVAWYVSFKFGQEMARSRTQTVIVLPPGATITTPPTKAP